MIRKIMLALGCLGIVIIAVFASGTFFVAQEAKEFVAAKVDEKKALECKAMRARFQEEWNRAVDSGRMAEVERQLSAAEEQINTVCGPR
ncbi:MAG: hypothetical protein ABL914_11160 [Novosphingobium sp.]|uniref:hypothetical protein n=1 Tax=Novosphingobium sp. TaxID=1874826 RepID=UPI0032BB3CF9